MLSGSNRISRVLIRKTGIARLVGSLSINWKMDIENMLSGLNYAETFFMLQKWMICKDGRFYPGGVQ